MNSDLSKKIHYNTNNVVTTKPTQNEYLIILGLIEGIITVL